MWRGCYGGPHIGLPHNFQQPAPRNYLVSCIVSRYSELTVFCPLKETALSASLPLFSWTNLDKQPSPPCMQLRERQSKESGTWLVYHMWVELANLANGFVNEPWHGTLAWLILTTSSNGEPQWVVWKKERGSGYDCMLGRNWCMLIYLCVVWIVILLFSQHGSQSNLV